ncbi:MAG: gluconokinase, GntK/IdnK-type [Bacteroidota bacterium]
MEQKQSSTRPNGERRNVCVLVVAGPAGSGKTSLGREVAARLGWAFEDADAHHSEAAKQKMARGEGLTDADRAPWLSRLADLVRERTEAGPPTVLACSALKRAYRETLLSSGGQLVWMYVPSEVLRQRLAERTGHVAGLDLLPSQLRDVEPPGPDERAWILDGARPLADLARDLADRLRPVERGSR